MCVEACDSSNCKLMVGAECRLLLRVVRWDDTLALPSLPLPSAAIASATVANVALAGEGVPPPLMPLAGVTVPVLPEAFGL